MANDVPNVERSPRNAWRHDWYPYTDYVTVHDSYMDKLMDEQLVLRQHLTFIETFADRRGRAKDLVLVQLTGRVHCALDVILSVEKRLEVRHNRRGRAEVRTSGYNYHAWTRRGQRPVLRYDNAHGDLHRHAFDANGQEVAITPIRLDELPTLDGVIRETVDLTRLVHMGFV